MLGSDFVSTYAHTGLASWEAAAVALAQQGGLVPWPWIDLPLSDDAGNTAVVQIQSDVVAVGSLENNDYVRLPLLPTTAQTIANLTGALLPTPWLAYQFWRAAAAKLDPPPLELAPNLGANLTQYAHHSALVDAALDQLGVAHGTAVAGMKKHVVVSNVMIPQKVVIFGWYRPSPPAPDVFDDRRSMTAKDRQPIQPLSNVHSSAYVDYSHGIQLVAPTCTVNGQSMATADLYQDPKLAALVSNEGPLRTPRYASPIPPPSPGTAPDAAVAAAFDRRMAESVVPTIPGPGQAPFTVSGRGRRGRNW